MEREQKITLWILLAVAACCFLLMIPPNLTGAETPEMLEVFEVDEYAQYPHVIRMLSKGDSFYQTLRNFVVYLHYYYGYPFYYWSALSILPVKWIGQLSETRIVVCVLRQMISVLPMLISALLLTWISGHFRNRIRSVLLFVFYMTMPAVLQNHFWWHPDSLTLLFLSLVFFFLDRDCLRCGRNFLLAAAACGAAVGTKYLGLYFALAIPLYLMLAMIRKTISPVGAMKKAFLFLAVMGAFILISDPLLLLPQERAEILAIMEKQVGLSGTGVFVRYDSSFFENGWLPSFITDQYAHSPLFLLCLISLAAGCFSRKNRKQALSLVLAAYLLVALGINLNAAAQRLHYFLPVFLPLFSVYFFWEPGKTQQQKRIFSAVFSLLLLIQIGLNLRTDAELYRQQLSRESESPAIRLYESFREEFLPLEQVPAERMTRVFRDWKIYFPEQKGYAIQTDWEMARQELIDEWAPDLIFLEAANIGEFSDPACLEQAVDPAQMQAIHSFYLSAAEDRIPGYREIFSDSFAKVFLKEIE